MEKPKRVNDIMIHFTIVIITFILVDIFPIGFVLGDEGRLVILLIALYIIGGFIFLDSQQKALVPFCQFLLYFVIFSFLLSIGGSTAMLLLIVNPIGLMLVTSWLPVNIEIPTVILYTVAAIFPPLFLYLGLILKRLYLKLTTKR